MNIYNQNSSLMGHKRERFNSYDGLSMLKKTEESVNFQIIKADSKNA
jgi:hypothetical protein